MKTIAVLLTVFNRREKTLQALHNLFAQQLREDIELKVFLVDDSCTDGTPEAVAQQFPEVQIIKSPGNLFWNRGMHLAWETAARTKDFDYYLWLNDDTELHPPHALTTLLETSANEQDLAIVVGSTCALKDTTTITYGGRTPPEGTLVKPPQEEAMPCAYFNGNIVLIPRYAYKKLGPNDPTFHHSLGDFDYGKRAAKIGIKNIVAPGILGKCDAHENLPAWCNPQKPLPNDGRPFVPLWATTPKNFLFMKNDMAVI